MKKQNKKGFTIVELVIVIAVIAILAAVLIPTFSNIIKKANQSKDTQVVRNMNTAIATADAAGNIKTFSDVVFELQKAGFVLGNLNPSSEGWIYVWENDSRQMIIVDTADDTVKYNSKELKNTAPCKDWFVITNNDDIATQYRDAGCSVTIVTEDAKYVSAIGKDLKTALTEAENGDCVVLTGNVDLGGVNVTKDVNFICLDGTAKIEGQTLRVEGSKNVTFQNVVFKDAKVEGHDNASCLYTGGGKIVLDGCTFENPQWDGIQVTPSDDVDIVIKNCTFKANQPIQRLLHFQCVNKTNDITEAVSKQNGDGTYYKLLNNCKVTIINNTFIIGQGMLKNDIIDVDYLNYDKDLVAYGNVFKRADDTIINSQADFESYIGKELGIFVCKTWNAPEGTKYQNKKDMMSYEDAWAFFTKTK